MPVRDFDTVNYLPILSLRPAEMNALQELPSRDKDLLLPLIPLGPWVGAHRLDSALSRVEDAFGRRPIVADLNSEEPDGARRPVHEEINRLRDPASGYANWCSFVRERPNYIPSVQIADLTELRAQIENLAALDRGVVLRMPEVTLGQAPAIARALSEHFRASDICVMLDFERQTRELLARQASAIGTISSIQDSAPGCFVSISASSFPDGFVGITQQQIYERLFFEGISGQAEMARVNLIYGDRGSARAERQGGGGGQPAPRVDYPSNENWHFFREEADDDRQTAYREAASRAMAAPSWDGALRLWGTQMIERTASGDRLAITSPARSTAVRINIHLHQQLHYGGAPDELHDTDDEWTD